METTQTTSILVPQEVSAFAAEQGVSAELPAVLELTRRVFPTAAVSAFVEDDPEIADDRHIVVGATGARLTVDQALEKRNEWHHGLFACCPAPLVCVFRLGLQLAP